jgi:PAS domain S-box-containing protein
MTRAGGRVRIEETMSQLRVPTSRSDRRPLPVNGGRPTRPRVAPDYRTLFEAAPGLFLVLAPDLTIVAVSDAYLAATMTRRDDILGKGLFEVFPDNPEDPAASGVSNLRASLDRVRSALVADTMAIQKYDIRRPASEGGGFEERFWSPVNSPVLDDAGRLAYIIHRVEDVTEFVRLQRLDSEQQRLTAELRSVAERAEADVLARAQEIAEANRQLQRANAELRRSEAFLDSVVENIPDMIFIKDVDDLRFVRFNRAGEELLGHPREELVGKSDYDFFPKDEADFFTAKDREVIRGGQLVDIPEEPIDTAQLGRRILHTKKLPVFDDRGRPAFLLGISEDITERKQADDALRAARTAAEDANRAKSEFLSRMSHELRTPLNAILGFSQLLELDDLQPEQAENVRYIGRAGRHLLELINEVLDISRIESGRLTLSPEPVAVGDLLDELSALVGPMADGRRIALRAGGATCTRHVMADRQRLKQVLLNLLSNAVKYNREGGSVTLCCRRSGSNRLRISVADTGYGIAPELMERLFVPFERLGAEHSAVEGTGMGLALSKGLMEAMGGSIGVESRLDEGSTFWVELALAADPVRRYDETRRALPGAGAAPTGRRVILMIEDNLSNQKLVERIVAHRPGAELVSTIQGGLGLELARLHRPDVILLDLHLPDIPGRDVLRALKASPELRHVPVVVVSADATPGQINRLRGDGAFAYLTKPLDVSEFLAVLDEALAAGGAGA